MAKFYVGDKVIVKIQENNIIGKVIQVKTNKERRRVYSIEDELGRVWENLLIDDKKNPRYTILGNLSKKYFQEKKLEV